MGISVCPVCGDWSDTRDWCKRCDVPMKPAAHVDRFSNAEPDYGSMQYQQYVNELLAEQAKESNMLQVEIMGSDNHVFTVQIDSVIEVPKKGTEIICGKCGNKVRIANVGVPYRPATNGQHDAGVEEDQTSVF